ncbi:MAG: peptidylprolyl isomerase [Nanobdellota archaeon]
MTAKKKATRVFEGKKHKTLRTKKQESRPSGRRTLSIAGLIVIIAIVAVLALTPSIQDLFTGNGEHGEYAVLATVNGEPITENEFNKQWNTLPPTVKLQVGKDALLDDMVNQELLLQEASEQGITTTIKETEGFIGQQLAQSGGTIDQFKEQLETQGINYEDMIHTYQRQLTIAKLFEQFNTSALNVTDDDIEEYYKDNKEQFYQEKQVTVRHILIEVNNQTNSSEARKLAENVSAQLDEENNSNFCSLVANYSMDLGSKNNCGEYTFGRGEMAAAFENASFEMGIGEREIVETQFGHHIILKMSESEAGYLNLNDTIQTSQGAVQINVLIGQEISQQKATLLYDKYVNALRQNATIIYKNDKEVIGENATDSNQESATTNQTIVLEDNVSVKTS